MASALPTSPRPDVDVDTETPTPTASAVVTGTVEPTHPANRGGRTAKAVIATSDAAAVVAAMVVGAGPTTTGDLVVGLLSVPLWIAAFAHSRLYVTRVVATRRRELAGIVRGVAWGLAGTASAAVAADVRLDRPWLALVAALAVGLLTLEREVVRQIFASRRRGGRHLRPVVIVGATDEGRALRSMFLTAPKLGYRVVGYVDAMRDSVVRETVDLVAATGATGVVIAPTEVAWDDVNSLARALCELGVHVEVSSALRDIAATRVSVRQVGAFPMLHLEPVRRDGWRVAAKRALDVLIATIALVAALPVLLLAAVAIKLDSRGPVLFRQRRLGKRHAPFDVLKLRTMVVDADALKPTLQSDRTGPLFKIRTDPRVTRVGRVLRKLSIDELPQLWNVLRGEMSVVGPRPALHEEMREWPSALHRRLDVKPGITGLWQVNGRSDGSFGEYIRWDLYYVDNWSLGADLAILARTVPVVLCGNGAY